MAGGITGLVEKPYEGAKEKGFNGFVKGTFRGVSGLILMPLSGAIDFVSMTSEGIKN